MNYTDGSYKTVECMEWGDEGRLDFLPEGEVPTPVKDEDGYEWVPNAIYFDYEIVDEGILIRYQNAEGIIPVEEIPAQENPDESE